MVLFFIGASSLDNAQKAFDYKQRSLERTVKTQRGLSLNPKSSKTVQALLEREAVLKEASGLILWHDVISNTTTLKSTGRSNSRTFKTSTNNGNFSKKRFFRQWS